MLSIFFAILTIADMQDDASDMLRFLLKYSEMGKKKDFLAYFLSFLARALIRLVLA